MLGFSPEEKFDCYKLCSAMMHMGDMQFKEKKEQAELAENDEAKKVSRIAQPMMLMTECRNALV